MVSMFSCFFFGMLWYLMLWYSCFHGLMFGIGPKSGMIPEDQCYEPTILDCNGLIGLVGSRLTRQVVRDVRCREFLDKLLPTIERSVGKVDGKCLTTDECEMLLHLLSQGSDVENSCGVFLSRLMSIDGDNVAIPEYCEQLVNEIGLTYCSVNGLHAALSSSSKSL